MLDRVADANEEGEEEEEETGRLIAIWQIF